MQLTPEFMYLFSYSLVILMKIVCFIISYKGEALPDFTVVATLTDNRNSKKAYRIVNDRIFLSDNGTSNDNSSTGEFCCNGFTATVLRDYNMPLGYIFFYAREAPAEAATPKLRMLLSGAAGIGDIATKRKTDEIVFDVQRERYPDSYKKKMVDGLTYEITILNVIKQSSTSFTNLRIQADVR